MNGRVTPIGAGLAWPHARIAFPAPPIGTEMMPSMSNGENGTRGTTPAGSGRKDAWAGLAATVVPVALGLIIGIAYLGYAQVQKQIKAQRAQLQSQHAELQSLKDKIQGMAATQSREPAISEIQGLLNHVDTVRGQPKQRQSKRQKQ
jgi:uncharacterized protein HemX